VHVLQVKVPFDPEAARAKQGVKDLRGGLVGDSLRAVPGATWLVGGDAAANLDYDNGQASHLPLVIGFVVLATMLIMLWVFRSIVLALVTAFVNLLSTAAAFGVLTLVFQHTFAQKLLDFHSTGAVINWIPLFTFAVLFGLSMDYHVFVLSRIRESVTQGMTPRDAVRHGIVKSAGTVTSAAVVMVSVFAIFGALHMVEMKELGLTLAVAILLDAVVVRGILLPALLTMLGRGAWWPSKLYRRAAARDTARVPQPVMVGAANDYLPPAERVFEH
jgi:RND superfamily putative drug exporter